MEYSFVTFSPLDGAGKSNFAASTAPNIIDVMEIHQRLHIKTKANQMANNIEARNCFLDAT